MGGKQTFSPTKQQFIFFHTRGRENEEVPGLQGLILPTFYMPPSPIQFINVDYFEREKMELFSPKPEINSQIFFPATTIDFKKWHHVTIMRSYEFFLLPI